MTAPRRTHGLKMLLFYCSGWYLAGLAAWLVGLVCLLRWGLLARRRAKHLPRQRFWIHCGLSAWFILCALTLPEVLFALAYDRTDSFNTTNVSDRWFRRHVLLNPQGFRDTEPFTRTVPDGRERIVFLGDSFTFGHGLERVEDRFSDRVGRELEREQPGKFVVANLSLTGIGVNDMPRLWQKSVVETDSHVDVLVYVVCLNDIEWMAREATEREYEPIRQLKPHFFLWRDTYFYNWLYYRVQAVRQPRLTNYYDYVRQYYRGDPWRGMERELDALRKLTRANGTELRLVIFPFLHGGGQDYAFRECHERLMDYAKSRQIKALDLEPVLTPHFREGLTVNPFDAHPNARAHQLAADAILRDLLSDLVQPLAEKSRKL